MPKPWFHYCTSATSHFDYMINYFDLWLVNDFKKCELLLHERGGWWGVTLKDFAPRGVNGGEWLWKALLPEGAKSLRVSPHHSPLSTPNEKGGKHFNIRIIVLGDISIILNAKTFGSHEILREMDTPPREITSRKIVSFLWERIGSKFWNVSAKWQQKYFRCVHSVQNLYKLL